MKRIIYLLLVLMILIIVLRRSSGYRPFNPVSEQPMLIPDVLSPDECKSLIKNPASPAANKLRDLAAELSGKPRSNVEPVYVIKNDESPGESVKCATNDSCDEFKNLGGERIGALVVYLNSEFKGGELLFPAHNGLQMLPRTGEGVYFRPLLSNRDVARGQPVTEGTKWSAIVYVRENNSKQIEVA